MLPVAAYSGRICTICGVRCSEYAMVSGSGEKMLPCQKRWSAFQWPPSAASTCPPVHIITQELKTGSPRSEAISRPSRVTRGQVITTAIAAYPRSTSRFVPRSANRAGWRSGVTRSASCAGEEPARERRHVVVDGAELVERRQEHDAQEALIGRQPEPRSVDAEDAGRAQEAEHVVLIGLARGKRHAWH